MKKHLFYSAALAITLFFTACSGDDNDKTIADNPISNTQVVGKWLIYKAVYKNPNKTISYSFNGECAREVLEFTDDKEVSETFYIDDNCKNGGTTYYTWWASGDTYQIGNINSFHHTVTVTDNELIVDASEEADYIKYYKKAN